MTPYLDQSLAVGMETEPCSGKRVWLHLLHGRKMLFGRLFIIRPVIRLRKSKMDVAGFQLQDTSSAAKLQKVEADDFEQVKSKPHSANLR